MPAGRTSTDDDSPVCSEAEVEAYTTLEIKTGECLVSIVEEGEIRQMGNNPWLLDTEATSHFTYDPLSLENYAECSWVLCGAGVNTFPIAGTRTLCTSLRSRGGGSLCDVDECCACFRPFPLSSVTETHCRYEERVHGYPRGHTNSLCKVRR